jgi:hypothetical protein
VIKAVGRTGAGQPLLVLGLSGENMTRLMADEPILIRMADVGLPDCVVAIVGGRTEDAIAEALEEGGLLERLADPEAGG